MTSITLTTTRPAQTPDTLQVLIEHQPREREVQCHTCGARTFDAQHGICDRCIDAGRLTTTCTCREGIRAAQVATEKEHAA